MQVSDPPPSAPPLPNSDVFNVFRILGDVSHTVSICILIWAIHSNKSAEGVSLITQVLYFAVFVSRYLDLFWTWPIRSAWNFTLKNFYILSALYIIILMMRVYARTREREKAWKMGIYAAAGSLLGAPFVMMLFREKKYWAFSEFTWTFSIILESVCVLPQLLLLRQTTVPTVIDSFYLLTLGSYRGFYILNWIHRYVYEAHHFDAIAVIFGVIQTALYIDFAWVYLTRQRVKLRNGGVVDSEDLSRGWLVSKVLGRGSVDVDVDEEERIGSNGRTTAAAANGNNNARNASRSARWGARGVSVSADEGLLDGEAPQPPPKKKLHPGDSLARDDELAAILEDDVFNDDDDEIDGEAHSPASHHQPGEDAVGDGTEWRIK